MAKITIREVDSTNPGVSATNPDVAYVPGYAIKGPVNTPTLCENLSTFQNLFGVKPYKFTKAQAYPSGFDAKAKPKKFMYEEGDYEKSYIYASELLSLGLPVIFERVLPEQIVDGKVVTDEDLTAKIYFTESRGILSKDLAFGTHKVTSVVPTAVENKEVVIPFRTDVNAKDFTLKVTTTGDSPITTTYIQQDDKLVESVAETQVGIIEDGKVTINANVIPTKDITTEFTYTIDNIYENESGELILEVYEDITEKICCIISAKSVGFSGEDTRIKYSKDQREGFSIFEITPAAELYPNAEAEVINFTYFEDQVNHTLVNPIIYYKDMVSNYVDFEWLLNPGKESELSTTAIRPDGISTLGPYWRHIQDGLQVVLCDKSYPEFTDNISVDELMYGLANPLDSIGNVLKRQSIVWTALGTLSPEYCIFDSSKISNGFGEFGAEIRFDNPVHIDSIDLSMICTAKLFWNWAGGTKNIKYGVFINDGSTYSNEYIKEAAQIILADMKSDSNPQFNVSTDTFLSAYNKNIGFDPKPVGIISLDSTDVEKAGSFDIDRDNITAIRIVAFTKLGTHQASTQHNFVLGGLKLIGKYMSSLTTISDLYINPKFESLDEFTVDGLYNTLSNRNFFNREGRLTDKGEYQIKYLTSGAYPVFEYSNNIVADNFLACAAERGDCVAIIDHTNNAKRAIIPDGSNTVFDVACEYFKDKNPTAIYGTMFTPWYRCNCGSVGQTLEMPASLAYLTAFAQSLKNYPNFLATAGAVRGVVPNFVSPCQLITNALADSYQPRNNVSINAITNIKPYGNLIWGNRTLKNNAVAGNLTAQSFLNVRNMSSDIKKVVYTTSKSLTFEQNNDITWGNFKAKIVPTLDKLQAGNGISGYQILKLKTTEKAKIVALIRIFPIEPVEDFDITIELSDAGVSIS